MRRILIVPHHLLDTASASFLERRSFKVRSVADAAEALATLSVWPPSLILFSSELADIPAADFARMIRGDARLAETKLLMLSPEFTGAVPSSVSEAEVDGHLVAPFTPADLLNNVGVLLDVNARRAPRLDCDLITRVERIGGDGGDMLANILRLSETGLLLECQHRLGVGELVNLQFVVPQIGRVTGRCIVLTADELMLHYSCEFIEIGDDSREVIRALVARQRSSAGAAGADRGRG